jgi:hypothetical protein
MGNDSLWSVTSLIISLACLEYISRLRFNRLGMASRVMLMMVGAFCFHSDCDTHNRGQRCRQGELLVAQEPGFRRLVVQQRQILNLSPSLSTNLSSEEDSFRYEAETTIHTEAEISTNSYETFLSSPFVLSARKPVFAKRIELFRIPSIEFRNLQAFSMNTVDSLDGVIFALRPAPATPAHQVPFRLRSSRTCAYLPQQNQ